MITKERIAFVINPGSGGGLGKTDRSFLYRFAASIGAKVASTERDQIAATVASILPCDSIWVVGGDGTIGQVVSSLHQQTDVFPTIRLIPAGTGNDFAAALGIAGSPEQVVRSLANGVEICADYGLVSWQDSGSPQKHVSAFTNVMGIGLDAEIAAAATKFKQTFGPVAYLIASLGALWSRRALQVRVRQDRQEQTVSCLFAAVCNGPRVGGGFFLTPDANPADGALDLFIARDAGWLRAIHLLTRLRSNSHHEFPEIQRRRIMEVQLIPDRAVCLHLDGDVVSHSATTITASVVRDRLKLVVPTGSKR